MKFYRSINVLLVFFSILSISGQVWAEPDFYCTKEGGGDWHLNIDDVPFTSTEVGSATSVASQPSFGGLRCYNNTSMGFNGMFGVLTSASVYMPYPESPQAISNELRMTSLLQFRSCQANSPGGCATAFSSTIHSNVGALSLNIPARSSVSVPATSMFQQASHYITVTRTVSGGAFAVEGGILGDLFIKLCKNAESICMNNIADMPSQYAVRLVIDPTVILAPAVCSVNDGNTISINYGDIATNRLSSTLSKDELTQSVPVEISCTGGDMQSYGKVTLTGAASSFSSSLLQSDNSNLGILLHVDNTILAPNQSANVGMLSTGKGNFTLHATPIVKSGANPGIGNFNATGILIFDWP